MWLSRWRQSTQGPLWGGGTNSRRPRHSWALVSSLEARTGRRGWESSQQAQLVLETLPLSTPHAFRESSETFTSVTRATLCALNWILKDS